MSNLLSQFARQKYVKRWNGRKTLSEFNLLEHTARVAFISRELMRVAAERDYAVGDSTKFAVMEYALLHDVSEVILGDITSPTKRTFPKLDKLMKKLEGEVMQPFGVGNISALTKYICKLADIVDCFYEALEEVFLGQRSQEFAMVVSDVEGQLGKVKKKYIKEGVAEGYLKVFHSIALEFVKELKGEHDIDVPF